MNALGGAELGAAGIVFAVVLLLVAVGGSQVYASAGRASDHLRQAAAIGAPSRDAAPGPAPVGAAPGGAASGGVGFGGLTERALRAGADDSSQQTFAQLTQYYAANLSQGQAIFWASFVSMVVGFGVVFAGIITAGANATTAIVGGVAGVLGQFIAATFLVALRSTQAQATAYAQTLVELRLRDLRAAEDAKATELGLALLGEITGDGAAALMNQTRAALAMGLIVKQPPAAPVVVTPPASDPDGDTGQGRGERVRASSVTFDAVGPPAQRRPAPQGPLGEDR